MSSAYFVTTTTTDFLNAGRTVTGLDLNGDGLGDLIIGADQAESSDSEFTGRVLVLFGSGAAVDFDTAALDLDTFAFDGTDGFVISGPNDGGEFGWDVLNAGDQNGDGRDDLAIVSRLDGTVTIIFGRADTDDFPADLDIGSGLGANGYTISGLGIAADAITVSGNSNVGGTSTPDLFIGVSGGAGTDSMHVVFGGATDIDVSTLNGTNGFTVTGLELVNVGDGTTESFNIGTIGDIDGDGTDDILLGRFGPDVNTGASGDIAILRSGTTTAASQDIDSFATSDLVVLTGLDAGVASTASVTGGFDINGDGDGDIVVGVPGDDTAGVNAGAVYVVYGGTGIADSVDLTALDGTDGFTITGLSAGDGLGMVVQSLGDVSGDGFEDLGILTQSGDLYLIYGIDNAATFPATINLNALNGSNGYAITGLFDAVPTSLSLSAVSINGDDINDISVGATFALGTEGETVVIMGGSQNLINLDAADIGGQDSEIALDEVGELTFAVTDGTIIVTGDRTAQITEDDSVTTGAIGVSDTASVDPTNPTFANRTATGTFGGLTVSADGTTWTYTVDTDQANLDFLQALSDGDSLFDVINVEAVESGTSTVLATQTITVEITGLDDPAVFDGELSPVISEDISQTTFAFTLSDVDGTDPSLAGQRFDGTAGFVQFNEAGDAYTVFITDPTLQDLGNGEDREETITITDSLGNTYDIDLMFTGSNEGTPIDFTTGPDDIFTSFGDDDINALGGDDNINPGAGDDTVDAGDGNDEIRDGLGNDTVNGEGDNDLIILLSGENVVDGGDGNDFIQTGYNDDTIDGGAGNDVISADSGAIFGFGNDTVTGGTGDDIMKAGTGADTFVFRPNDGNDTIAEFNEALVTDAVSGFNVGPSAAEFESGIDKISLVGFATVNATNIFDFIADAGASAQFVAEGTTITFFNVAEAQLSVDDFIFS